jgi:hypothetical protein
MMLPGLEHHCPATIISKSGLNRRGRTAALLPLTLLGLLVDLQRVLALAPDAR